MLPILKIRVGGRTVGHTARVANLRQSVSDPGATAVRNHVNDRLSEKDRQRMVEIVKASKGRPSNLSDRQRKELKSLLDQVEPRELAKTVATSGFAGRFA